MRKRAFSKRIVIPVVVLVFSLGIRPLIAQEQDEARKIWDSAFRAKRPATPTTSVQKQPVYRLKEAAAGALPSLPLPEASFLGVTILKLRPASAMDDREVRLLVQENATGKSVEWTPVRVEGGTPLAEGERVRLSIESPQKGYLYVVDREQYADGELGDGYLIFPTLRTLGGKNEVLPGRVVEIPAWDDAPPFFRLRRSRPDHVAEVLTILVAPEPLPGLTLSQAAIKLEKETIETWEKKWAAAYKMLEMENGAGRAYTREEKLAGQNAQQPLTQDQPMPQTIYCVFARKGNPLLFRVTLPIASAKE